MTPPDSPTHLTTWLRSLLQLLKQHGYKRQDLLKKLGLDETEFMQPLGRVEIERSNLLWAIAYEHCQEQMGLKVAAEARIADYQVIGGALTVTQTVKEAILELEHYFQLLTDTLKIESSVNAHGVSIRCWYDAELPWSNERMEAVTLIGCNVLSQLLDSPLQLERVTLTRPKPSNPLPWQQAFNAPIEWNGEFTTLRISAEQANRPILTRNKDIQPSYRSLLNSLLFKRGQEDPLATIRQVISGHLGDAQLNLQSVATRLKLSERSVQRRLQESGVSFRSLLNELRRDKALSYFREGKTANEVAYLLGFSNPSVFHRAFKKWTGHAPTHYYPDNKKQN